jgi:hypothetical protein
MFAAKLTNSASGKLERDHQKNAELHKHPDFIYNSTYTQQQWGRNRPWFSWLLSMDQKLILNMQLSNISQKHTKTKTSPNKLWIPLSHCYSLIISNDNTNTDCMKS